MASPQLRPEWSAGRSVLELQLSIVVYLKRLFIIVIVTGRSSASGCGFLGRSPVSVCVKFLVGAVELEKVDR